MAPSEEPWFSTPDVHRAGRSNDARGSEAFTFDDVPPSSAAPPDSTSWSSEPGFAQPVPSRRALVSRPATMWIAIVALVVAATLCLVTALLGVLAIVQLRAQFDELTGVDPSGLVRYHTDEYADGATHGGIVLLIVLAIALAASYTLFARGVWSGKRWPRVWGSVLAVVSVFGLFGGPLLASIVVSGIVAVVALWLPDSRKYCDYAISNPR